MNNTEKVQLTEEEEKRNATRRASAARLEKEGDNLMREERYSDAVDPLFRSWNLRTYLMSKNAKNESWEDFLRISHKYASALAMVEQNWEIEKVAANLLNAAFRRFDNLHSIGFTEVLAHHNELKGMAFYRGMVLLSILCYNNASEDYDSIGQSENARRCHAIAEFISRGII